MVLNYILRRHLQEVHPSNSVTTSSSSSEASLSSWQLCDESEIEELLTSVDILMQQGNETAAKVHNITSHDVTIKLN